MQQVLETCDGLVLGTLDSQSLGLGLVLGMEVCLSILSFSFSPASSTLIHHQATAW